MMLTDDHDEYHKLKALPMMIVMMNTMRIHGTDHDDNENEYHGVSWHFNDDNDEHHENSCY